MKPSRDGPFLSGGCRSKITRSGPEITATIVLVNLMAMCESVLMAFSFEVRASTTSS